MQSLWVHTTSVQWLLFSFTAPRIRSKSENFTWNRISDQALLLVYVMFKYWDIKRERSRKGKSGTQLYICSKWILWCFKRRTFPILPLNKLKKFQVNSGSHLAHVSMEIFRPTLKYGSCYGWSYMEYLFILKVIKGFACV